MNSEISDFKNNPIFNAKKYCYFVIGVIVFIAALLIFLGIKSFNKSSDSFRHYIFDGSVYNDEKYNIRYDTNNNIVYFDSSDDDDYTISYKYSYNSDNKISKISFEGIYFSSEINGEFNFKYNGNNISTIELERKYKDVTNVYYYVFHYDDRNRVIRVDHDKGGIWTSTAESPYGCNYYYYDKYVISDCYNTEINQPNLKESYTTEYRRRSVYVDDDSLRKSDNVWIANNISPFIYYGIDFPRGISSDVSLLGSSYDVAYNPGKILYSVQKDYNSLNNKTNTFAERIYYSNGNIIKGEYGKKLDVWEITMFKDDKRISSIDSMNSSYEFLYSYKGNDINQNKKQSNKYSDLVKKYNNYFKSSKLDYDIDDIIEKLDSIIQEQKDDGLSVPIINTELGEQTDTNQNPVNYSFEFDNTNTVTFSLNGENVDIVKNRPQNTYCQEVRTNRYNCYFILKEGLNDIVVVAKNNDNKQTIRKYTINFVVVEPSIKIENNYYNVAINDNQWKPRFILSDNIDYYDVTWYFDNQKWSRSQTFDYIETRDDGILYSVWIPGLVIGTKSADPGIHTMKVEIRDKRTDKIAFDEATIECY